MIIGITGTLFSGKRTLIGFLKKRGFKNFSVAEFIAEKIKEKGYPLNQGSFVYVLSEIEKEFGKDYVVKELYKKAKELDKPAIIEGIKSKEEVMALKEKDNFYLFSIDSTPFLRYERTKENKMEDISYEQFLENEGAGGNLSKVKECFNLADFHFINDGSKDELELATNRVLDKLNLNYSIKEIINWEEYFFGVASLIKRRSKDPKKQVGACIIDKNKQIIGTGYNGFPKGASEQDFSWEESENFLKSKETFLCHASLNAILVSNRNELKNSTIYITEFPCNNCAKVIIQSGIRKVKLLKKNEEENKEHLASIELFEKTGIEYEFYEEELGKIILELK